MRLERERPAVSLATDLRGARMNMHGYVSFTQSPHKCKPDALPAPRQTGRKNGLMYQKRWLWCAHSIQRPVRCRLSRSGARRSARRCGLTRSARSGGGKTARADAVTSRQLIEQGQLVRGGQPLGIVRPPSKQIARLGLSVGGKGRAMQGMKDDDQV